MRVVKFEGFNMKEALAKAKQELGADAVIVSTRRFRRGLRTRTEVAAAVDGDPAVVPQRRSDSRRATTEPGLGQDDVDKIISPLRSELRWLRSMLRAVSERRPDDDVREEIRALRSLLERNSSNTTPLDFDALADDDSLARASEARVVALVGSTGVGKTTSIAKLAARAALVDKLRVGIITLDNYRIGAEEQMREYADLIGADLLTAGDANELTAQVRAFDYCDRVFIDTAGRSPRDTAAIRGLRSALSTLSGIEVHLALSATASPGVVDAVFARFKAAGISRLLFTKLDEAADLLELVEAPTRLRTPVSYIATGQLFPEDIHCATPRVLAHLARDNSLNGATAA